MKIANDLRSLPRVKGTRGAPHGPRWIHDVVGITLHQTATRDFSPQHPGLKSVPAHAMVHRDGSVSLLHDFLSIVWHGNAANHGTIGIEIACRAAGTEGDPSTFWISKGERKRGATFEGLVAEATDEQLQGAYDLCRWYCEGVSRAGGAIRGMWSHRQAHWSRTSDPGSRIWKAVGEAVRLDLGLADVRDLVLGTGKPIPESWRRDS